MDSPTEWPRDRAREDTACVLLLLPGRRAEAGVLIYTNFAGDRTLLLGRCFIDRSDMADRSPRLIQSATAGARCRNRASGTDEADQLQTRLTAAGIRTVKD